MVQKYYNVERTAEILGITEEQVKEMLSQRKLHGYRDGADWKFKIEDIDKLADEKSGGLDAALEDDGDMLFSEIELGESDPGASGTVIGVDDRGKTAADSDIKLGSDSGISLADDSQGLDSKLAQFEELDLTLEEDLTLADSQVQPIAGGSSGGSGIELLDDALEDDDLVLGGSGTGSDITIGGDSGISLVDPADSGLSLEEPLELAASGAESLELSEDDMLSLGEDTDADSPTELKTDDDFLLTPLEEADADDSESGSQVIALDTMGGESATMLSEGAGLSAGAGLSEGAGSMAAMLDEDLSAEPADGMGIGAPLEAAAVGGAPLGVQSGGFAEGAPVTVSASALAEAPYSVWNIAGLSLCTILLILCGMFMFDLMLHMWSWDNPAYSINSSLMDTILGWFE